MKKMTESNMKESFAGESHAHVKYLVFAERAQRDGFPEVARLFRAASFAEQVHATAHLRVLGGIGATAENLAEALGGENFEVQEMYPAFAAVANLQEEKAAARSIQWALDAERVHAQLYARAREAVDLGRDTEMGPVAVCGTCGYTAEGEAPDRCPLCGAPKARFSTF